MDPLRRQFIRGQWLAEAAADPSSDCAPEIASVLVQIKPERLATVEAAIERIAGASVAQRDACGKLVVLLESSAGRSIGESLTEISLLPHVLSASLVFHGVDTS